MYYRCLQGDFLPRGCHRGGYSYNLSLILKRYQIISSRFWGGSRIQVFRLNLEVQIRVLSSFEWVRSTHQVRINAEFFWRNICDNYGNVREFSFVILLDIPMTTSSYSEDFKNLTFPSASTLTSQFVVIFYSITCSAVFNFFLGWSRWGRNFFEFCLPSTLQSHRRKAVTAAGVPCFCHSWTDLKAP